VAEDVREGKVSRAAAQEEYGVVIDDDLAVDVAATERRRSAMRRAAE
jgi:N-methylhydantoinase B